MNTYIKLGEIRKGACELSYSWWWVLFKIQEIWNLCNEIKKNLEKGCFFNGEYRNRGGEVESKRSH